MADFIEKLPKLLLAAVDANPLLGYGAIALVMLLENVVPSIPSEVVMPLAGFPPARWWMAWPWGKPPPAP
ncbi:hypothetical protein [Cyanobium sp. WAJ14-Wanaka]|uniref:hypothetical protein n=1 Tax=Cyanobium sp. WAJ14-Wanaka TaxID=2823725 RepID=UPI0020CBD5A6|nr:hypothetical protein [Cyanobium sp. WAJ14-Wanaka]MCP9774977.1 hypothetical protein [Cyanobium sp. WAJ14-Wanaka]